LFWPFNSNDPFVEATVMILPANTCADFARRGINESVMIVTDITFVSRKAA